MDDLFEGIQILSPTQLENSLQEKEKPDTEETVTNDDVFNIVPVTQVSDEKEIKEETTDNTEEKPEGTQSKSSVAYKALIKELVKEGIITVSEGEDIEKIDGNFDTIKSLVEKTLEQKLKDKEDNWKKSFSGAKKRFLEIEDAFSDADHAILMAQRLEYLESLNEDAIKKNPQLQKQIIFEELKGKGFSDQDAVEFIEEIEEGKLEEKAIKAFPSLKSQTTKHVEKSREERAKIEEAQKAEATETFNKLLGTIEEKKSFIDGLELNKVSREKLKNNITNIVHKDEKTGKEMNSLMYKQHRNPVEFELLINYYDSLGLFNIDKTGNFKPDISKLKTIAKTTAVNELDQVLASEERTLGGGGNFSSKTESALSLLKEAFKNKK
jgi:hypothetical protein